jgi:hypothetical protein
MGARRDADGRSRLRGGDEDLLEILDALGAPEPRTIELAAPGLDDAPADVAVASLRGVDDTLDG